MQREIDFDGKGLVDLTNQFSRQCDSFERILCESIIIYTGGKSQ